MLLKKYIIFLSTIIKLGIHNVLYIAFYRFTIKTGLRKLFFKQYIFYSVENFYKESVKFSNIPEDFKDAIINDAKKLLNGQIRYFSYHWKQLGNPPNWLFDPFTKKVYPDAMLHWTHLPDFHKAAGDIKNIWEPSRFEWVITFARAYSITANNSFLSTLNNWLKDWTIRNPLNVGPNWKCGQEASIRIFNLLNASYILGQHFSPSKSMIEFIEKSLIRIDKNIHYAIVQENNHGVSEAAALFIGGSWLMKVKPESNGKKYSNKGRKWLENRVIKLISQHGSFSQHSVNYHRLVIDTLCFAEFWRRLLNLEKFSPEFYEKVIACVDWLCLIYDEVSGNAPNLGGNDGTMLLNFHSCSYLDYRPSIQLSNILFKNKRIIYPGKWDEVLLWLNIVPECYPVEKNKKNTIILDNSYLIINNNLSWALIKLPYYKYRPVHNDVFHFDFWINGKNVLCDSGSFSYYYGSTYKELNFRSVNFHNTLSFDGKEQMYPISRFLLGSWIKLRKMEFQKQNQENGLWKGEYIDYRGNIHIRTVKWSINQWQINDKFNGKSKSVHIGFNIDSPILSLDKTANKVELPDFTIKVSKNASLELSKIRVSKFYQHLVEINRLNIKSLNNSEITTIISIKK